MASDTATLDLERVHEQRRRLEAERDGQATLGPDDQAPADESYVDRDPATRAAEIVQEVLAAAERRRSPDADLPVPSAAEGTAAARARRIVEEVLSAASVTSPTGDGPATDTAPDDGWEPMDVRADLVLLTASEPLVLLPGEAFDPADGAYVPDELPAPLPSLVDRVLASVQLDEAPAEADELTTPTSVTEAIRGAGESSNRHGVRWIVAGAVWALAFGLAGPLAYKALVSSADMTIELWDREDVPVAEQQVEVPEDELPPETAPGEQAPPEAELDG